MLTRDIRLLKAIIDLADNSVDGALQISRKENYEGFSIIINVDAERLIIKDNCGGIPFEVAKDYAFRLGRRQGTPTTDQTIGQFGVGMKRAFFKAGNRFIVESQTQDSYFRIDQRIDEWLDDPFWDFTFDKVVWTKDEGRVLDQDGTSIEITELYEAVSLEFSRPIFVNQLKSEISTAHQFAIEKGLGVSLNGVPVQFRASALLESEDLTPGFSEFSIDLEDGTVESRIICGISESNPRSAGWYIYCNGRCILEADQSAETGWGSEQEKVPQYHNQYSRFRGYVFLVSDNPGLLPWNTTKSDLNLDSRVYRSVLQRMVDLMKPVLSFLNKLAKDKDDEDTEIKKLVNRSNLVSVGDIKTTPAPFQYRISTSRVESEPRIPVRKIAYEKPESQIAEVQKLLKVRTLKQVGEKTFDYFYEQECE